MAHPDNSGLELFDNGVASITPDGKLRIEVALPDANDEERIRLVMAGVEAYIQIKEHEALERGAEEQAKNG